MKHLAVLLLTVGLLAVPAWAKNHTPKHWQKAVKNTNERVHRRSVFSSVGDNVSLSIQRSHALTVERYKLQKMLTSTTEKKYMMVDRMMRANPLFKNYKLTITSGVDLTYNNSEHSNLKKFFEGTLPARRAWQYKKVVLVELYTPGKIRFWFVIDPYNQLVTFIYNDKSALEDIPELQTKRTPLSVR